MSSIFKTELLAPAKDKETAFAAIDCGADAVYIGASSFGARKNATNSIDDIKEVVEYAHKFWAKVFVTVNTILKDDELEEAVELVKTLDSIGVDANELHLIKDLCRFTVIAYENEDARETAGVFILVLVGETDGVGR